MIYFTIQDGMKYRSNVGSMDVKCDGLVEKRLSTGNNEMKLNAKPLFESDDENEENGREMSVSRSKREGSVMVDNSSVKSKKMKTVYDPALYLEAIEKASTEKAKLLQKKDDPTKCVLCDRIDE